MGRRGVLSVRDRGRADIAFALANGWQLERFTGSGHMLFKHPVSNGTVTLAGSTGYPRAIKNGLLRLRRLTP